MNAPPPFALRIAGTVGTMPPLIWINIAELAANPFPMICTVPPVLADVGVKAIVGSVRANVAFAAFPDASVMVKVFVGVAVNGIANVVESPPVALVVDVLKATAAPLTFAVTALRAANPVPVTVIVVPLLPVAGVTSIDGPTVIAAWTIRFVFASIIVSKYVPAKRLAGTTNVVVVVNAAAPATPIVVGPNAEVPIRSTPPNVAVEIADSPVTVMVLLEADFTVAGATIVGVPITLIAALAVSLGLVAVSCNV